jgi:hypothetical protein
MTTITRVCIALVAIAFVPGCIAVPVPVEPRVVEGQPFADSDLAFVQPGTTTRDDVIESIGKPMLSLTDQRILVYGLRKVDAVGGLWFIGAGYGAAGGLVEGESREALFFALDSHDIVIDWGRASVRRGETWLSAATGWSRSEGLEIEAARDQFIQETPTSEESLVYFYRPRDFQHILPLAPPAERLMLGVAEIADIRVDDELVGQIHWKSYALIRVRPGSHEFVVDPDTDYVVNPEIYQSETIRLAIEPDTVTFVDVGIKAGYGLIKPVLVQRPRNEAIAVIERLPESW